MTKKQTVIRQQTKKNKTILSDSDADETGFESNDGLIAMAKELKSTHFDVALNKKRSRSFVTMPSKPLLMNWI